MAITPAEENAKTPYFLKRLFFVEIDGFEKFTFTKGSFPKVKFKEAAHKGAGRLNDQFRISGFELDNLTFEKGILEDGSDSALYDWVHECIDIFMQTGKKPADYMRDIDVGRMDEEGSEIVRYRLFDAYPVEADFGEGEGGSDENDMEKLVLRYHRFQKM